MRVEDLNLVYFVGAVGTCHDVEERTHRLLNRCEKRV
jgi:hypothetical protein